MIAIVGAKGGCGKTTTTLGLAQAFARAGAPAIAVDTDRQLPNLHVAANVDRKPTLGSLVEDADVTSVAQQQPETPGVGILPAPTRSESIDLEQTTPPLKNSSAAVLLDCPAGAGPDVVEPLSIADQAIVVTTKTDRSVTAATTTVEIADQLGVPVLGAIVTRCRDTPGSVETSLDVPVIGTVPDRESPLSSQETMLAYDGIAADLKAKSYEDSTVSIDDRMVGRLETGIDVLDRKLEGGVPPGCVVAYTADPASQSELLLYELTAARGTLYLTTERSDEFVRRAIESSRGPVGSPTVRHLQNGNSLEEATRLISALPDGANLIIDPMDVLERSDRREYVTFLNDLKTHMVETGSIAVLHCLKTDAVPENRSSTKHLADAVFDLQTEIGATELENHLTIPKFRGGGAPTETIKLELSEAVEIDTSRDIA